MPSRSMIWDSICWDPIWGQVGFDENGDRQAAYELWNYQPDAWKATRGECFPKQYHPWN